LPGSGDGSIELAVRLADTTITARDLEQLQPGDIVATEQLADGLVDVYQNGVLAYQAQLGAYQGRRAIEICRAVDDSGTTPHE
jgi:flagellar motor switch protein FliM